MTPNWRDFANCSGMSTSLFFPFDIRGGSPRSINALAREANSVCRLCIVKQDCLEYAIEQRIDDGIFGGLDEIERRRYVRERRRSA